MFGSLGIALLKTKQYTNPQYFTPTEQQSTPYFPEELPAKVPAEKK